MKRIELAAAKQMKTLDIVLLGRSVRTSHNPRPKGLHSGMPTGQRYCTLCRSAPTANRSIRFIAFSQSRTGSLPAVVR